MNVETVNLHEATRHRYLSYAMSVITSRALPDVRDGLKPVQRRILYAMYHNLKLYPDGRFRKSAAVVGEAMAKYHPHGDSAIYDAMVRMAQSFSLRHPLIAGQGNFGSLDGDAAAAMRYCVTGDTLIRTPSGTFPIAQLAPAAGISPDSEIPLDLEVYDHLQRPVRASRLFHSGDHPTLCLRTQEGYTLRGTGNHPVLCLASVLGVPTLLWKLLEEVRPDDCVVLARPSRPDIDTPLSQEDADLAVLLGGVISEGWFGDTRAGFNNTDKVYFDAVIAAYDRIVGGARYLSRRVLPSGKDIHELDVHNLTFLQASPLAELQGQKSEQKRLPDTIWSRSLAFKRLLLQALYEGDGSSSLLPRSTIQIAYCTKSPKLARQVQALLLELGVISKLSHARTRTERKVIISNRRDARLFAERVGFWGVKQEKLLRELAAIPAQSSSLSHDAVPFLSAYVRDVEDSPWLKRHNFDRIERWERDRERILSEIQDAEVRAVVTQLHEAGYYYARVAAIDEGPVQPVYSLRVESDSHAFLTNGFVSHNTESKLSAIAVELLSELKQKTTDYRPNYDGQHFEPVVLPAQFPQLLVNGAEGIAVGMATRIPPHNLREVIDAATMLIDTPDVAVADLMRKLRGPDFPTGGAILNNSAELQEIYETGSGSVRIQGEYTTEEQGRQRAVIITSIPYGVNKAVLIEKIGELIATKKVPQLVDVRDESTDDVRIVMELRKSPRALRVEATAAMAYLYKHTPLQSTFPVNLTCLVPTDNPEVCAPIKADLAQILRYWLDFRQDTVRRRFTFELERLRERIHILEAFARIFDVLDAVIEMIRASDGKRDAHHKLMERFQFSDEQAEAILELKLYRLAKLEIDAVQQELEEKRSDAARIEGILSSAESLWSVVRQELQEIRRLYGEKRRTTLGGQEIDYDESAYIVSEDTYLMVTRDGWIKRQGSFTTIDKIRLREGDHLAALALADTRAAVTFFTNQGAAYVMRIDDVPQTTGYGEPIQKHFGFSDGETVVGVVVHDPRALPPGCETEGQKEGDTGADGEPMPPYGVAVTRQGKVMRFPLAPHSTPSNRTGRRYAKVEEKNDGILAVYVSDGTGYLSLASAQSRVLSFKVDEIPINRGPGKGVLALRLEDSDHILGFELTPDADTGMKVVTPQGREEIVRFSTFGGSRATKGRSLLKRGTLRAWERPLLRYDLLYKQEADVDEVEGEEDAEGEGEE